MMKKEVNLHFNSLNRGPGKVVENIAKGLNLIGIKVTGNNPLEKDVYQSCLQVVPRIQSLPRTTLMGPNLFVLPSEWGGFCQNFSHYVVPSQWILSKYREFSNLDHATIDIWPVGIETDVWKYKDLKKRNKVLVYVKNRDQSIVDGIFKDLKNHSFEVDLIVYGNYREEELYKSCMECSVCVLITNTESQGIAYMQILSSGIPCFVLDSKTWDNEGKYKQVPATSVPYFNEKCGFIREKFDMKEFNNFISSYDSFDPRSFIFENHSLEVGSRSFLKILENINASF